MPSPPLGYLVNAAAVLGVDWLDLVEDGWVEFRQLRDGAPAAPKKPTPSAHVH
jgi:hypothetical protein